VATIAEWLESEDDLIRDRITELIHRRRDWAQELIRKKSPGVDHVQEPIRKKSPGVDLAQEPIWKKSPGVDRA
jgi:hypothetical protein